MQLRLFCEVRQKVIVKNIKLFIETTTNMQGNVKGEQINDGHGDNIQYKLQVSNLDNLQVVYHHKDNPGKSFKP